MQPEGPYLPSGSEPEQGFRAQFDALQSTMAGLQLDYTSVCEKNAGLQTEIDTLRETNEVLKQRVESLRRMLFGPKSERFVPDPDWAQGTLFEGLELETSPAETAVDESAETQAKASDVKKPTARKRLSRETLPPDLPRRRVVIEPKEDVSAYKCIGEEVSWYLERVPATIEVVELVRPKYVDPNCEDRGVIMAALPDRLIDRGKAGPGLLADIITSKYVDHLPLDRQAKRFKRQGIRLSTSALGNWVGQVSWHLEPLYELLKQDVRASGYVQADETTMPVQDRTKKGETHRGYYWTYLAPDAGLVAVDYCNSRARAGPVAFLEGFEGALQTDGYKAYDGFEAESLITTYGCMAHARRYFYDCLQTDPDEAPYVVGLFRELYAIERGLRKINACAKTRMKARQEEAKPILDKLEKWMKEKKVLPSSKLAEAINYSLNRWDKLIRYVDNGRIEIDNNLVENAVRPFALGRKNYLFAGSHKAAQRAAVLYSLLGTCKLQGINPQKWLTDVLDRLPTHPAKRASELLPHNWKKAQQPALKKAA